MRFPAVVLVVAALLGGSSSDVSGGSRTVPNVRGIVTRGPIAPVCREGEPCDEPAAGVVLSFTRAGVQRARIRTDAAGRFALRLAPGRYTVGMVRPPAIGGLAPVAFTVRASGVVRLRLSIDTGIR